MHKKFHTKYFFIFNTHLHHAQKEEAEEDRPQWGRRPRRRKHSEKKVGKLRTMQFYRGKCFVLHFLPLLFFRLSPLLAPPTANRPWGGKRVEQFFSYPPTLPLLFLLPPPLLPVRREGGFASRACEAQSSFLPIPTGGGGRGKGEGGEGSILQGWQELHRVAT